MKQLKINSLEYYNDLKNSGLSETTANVIACHEEEVIHFLVSEVLVTKQDLRDVKSELKQEIKDVRNELKNDIKDLTGEIKQTELRLENKIDKILWKVLTGVGFLLSIAISIQHFWK